MRMIPLAALVFSLCGEATAPSGNPATLERFCLAWKRIAPTQKSYDDALQAVLAELSADLSVSWKHRFTAMLSTTNVNHLPMLRGYAREDGAVFTCDLYEFPGGKPEGTVVSPIDNVVALSADDSGLFGWTCEPNRTCTLGRLGTGAKIIAFEWPRSGLAPQLLLDGDDVLTAVDGMVIAVAKSGGPLRQLGVAWDERGLIRSGTSLLFADTGHGEIQRLPRAGGTVETLAKGFDRPTLVLPAPNGVVIAGTEQPVYFLESPEAARQTVIRWANEPVVLDGVLIVQTDAGLARYDPAVGKPEALGAMSRVGRVFASQGELLGVDLSVRWPGMTRILKWKPGAKEWVVAIQNAGVVGPMAADSHQIYWVDPRRKALYAAPR
jgi:hypothetical protein